MCSGKIYYIYTNFEGSDIISKDLYSLDVETKETEIIVEDAGDFLEKELTFKDDKIYSLYVLRGTVYETVIDIATKKIIKTNLFRAVKTTDFELTSKDIFPSIDFSKYVFMYYTQKEGYQLRLYDKATKKTSTLMKDKDYILENILWKNGDEIVFKKTPAFSVASSGKESIISLNINDLSSERVILESSLDINTVLLSEDMILLSEDNKMFIFKKEKEELGLAGFFGIQDTLTAGVFNYSF